MAASTVEVVQAAEVDQQMEFFQVVELKLVL